MRHTHESGKADQGGETPPPIEPGNPTSMTIRDAVARKVARDLLTDDPELDVERFLKDCEALSQSPQTRTALVLRTRRRSLTSNV